MQWTIKSTVIVVEPSQPENYVKVKLGIISPSSTTGSNKQKNETTTTIRIHLQSQFDRKYLHHDKCLIYQNDLILFWGLKQIKRHWILNWKLRT